MMKIANILMCIWCCKIKAYWIQHAICAVLFCSILQLVLLRLDQGHVTIAPGVEISPTGPSDSDDSERFGNHVLPAMYRCNEQKNLCYVICVMMCLCLVFEDYIPKTSKLKGCRSNMQSKTKLAEQWLSKGPVPVLGSSMNETFLNISNASAGWEVPYTGSLGVKDFSELQTCQNDVKRTISAGHQRSGEQMYNKCWK